MGDDEKEQGELLGQMQAHLGDVQVLVGRLSRRIYMATREACFDPILDDEGICRDALIQGRALEKWYSPVGRDAPPTGGPPSRWRVLFRLQDAIMGLQEALDVLRHVNAPDAWDDADDKDAAFM